jgi:inner membrane protein
MPDFQNFEMTYWVWFAAAAVLAIMEIIAPGIFMIWLAMAAAVTGVVTLALGFGWELQLAVFAILSVVAVFLGRNFLKRNPVETSDTGLNRRGERLVGPRVKVVESITDGRGRVQVGDSPWLATGPDAPTGSMVRIVGVDGATLKVEPA